MKKTTLRLWATTRFDVAPLTLTIDQHRLITGAMMRFLTLLLTITIPVSVNAQQRDSTTVKAVFGSRDKELEELMSVVGIEKYHIEFNDPQLIGRLFRLTYQEHKDGVAQPEQDMLGRFKETFRIDSTGKLAFDIYARAVDATTIEAFFRFAQVGQRKTFKVAADDARQYSFRTDILPYKQQQTRVPIGQKFTFLVHTLPYEKDGFYQYCALAQSQLATSEWYKQFGIKHFIAYQLVLE